MLFTKGNFSPLINFKTKYRGQLSQYKSGLEPLFVNIMNLIKKRNFFF